MKPVDETALLLPDLLRIEVALGSLAATGVGPVAVVSGALIER